ncbi:M1 family aminopeptidase [Muricauda sp. 334s03]|uniref:M1 family aminopeptidase n=1 Tax=Flagellimonas yonaguniensis TaxID=3031325 RepID=A0ABT5Y3T2_9FLAO|nr:M1 family aminopeptidase [[Muricauda] yonaguniensis]MDF0718003.1 M1 family aminopeptidase [[Muricauda] yonaguniensis]
MFKRVLLTALLATILFSCQHQPESDISYEIASVVVDSIPQLKITMTLEASPDGTTELSLPNDAWGQTDLYNSLGSMALLNVEGAVEKDADSNRIVLMHPKDVEELEFEYFLKQDFKEDVSTDKIYRPIINQEYFHVFSHNMFMVPENTEEQLDILLDWSSFPEEGYTIHNSFGSQERVQLLKDQNMDLFGSAIFVGGDFRVFNGEIEGNRISLATRGEWIPFKDEDVFKVLEETLTYQRNFWDDHSQTYFTVIMQPFPLENGSSFQGTGLTNSFATSVSNNDQTDIGQMVYLFNHELMHNWLGHTIHNENEEEQYWFSEGFTEYYTFKNIAKNNINELDGTFFIAEMNRTIRDLYASSVGEAPNSEINYDNFWTSYEYSKLPYWRGTIFAFYLDRNIQKISGGKQSLDDVMHQIHTDATTKDQKVNHDYFVGMMDGFWEGDFEPVFQKYIEEGQKVDLAALFDDLGLDYSPESDIYELGFEFTKDRKEIAGVAEGSKAWEAGVRVGDKVFSRSIWQGSIEHQVKLGLKRNGKEFNVSFYPVTKAEVPQLKPTTANMEKLGF